MKNLINRVLTISGGSRRRGDKLMSDDKTETSPSCELCLAHTNTDETTATIKGQSLLSGRISLRIQPQNEEQKEEESVDIISRFKNYFAQKQEEEESADIINRFKNYFALFDGRSIVELTHHARVEKAVADLFHESVLDDQMDQARHLLAKETCITVNNIEKCRTGGRIFYHLKVSTKRNTSIRQHITGFATVRGARVTEVETKVKIIRSPGYGKQQFDAITLIPTDINK